MQDCDSNLAWCQEEGRRLQEQLADVREDLTACDLALAAAKAVLPALQLLKARPFLDALTIMMLLYMLAWFIWEHQAQPFAFKFPPNK